MQISLRRGERIFINGAVLRVDRKVSIELMNDVTFLLEHHIIQPHEASSPLKKLYLAIQTILISPADREKSLNLCLELIATFLLIKKDQLLINCMIEVRNLLKEERAFDALKSLRVFIMSQSEPKVMRGNQLHSINQKG